jgi:hypothetical protein
MPEVISTWLVGREIVHLGTATQLTANLRAYSGETAKQGPKKVRRLCRIPVRPFDYIVKPGHRPTKIKQNQTGLGGTQS